MRTRTILAALAVLATSTAMAVDASAQSRLTVGKSVVYRLNAGAGHAEGCVPPCLCPVFFNDDIRGTFNLTPTSFVGTVIEYDVSDVNWIMSGGSGDQRVTGSGKYTRISGFAGWIHQLQLELSIDGGPPQKFDSGLVNEVPSGTFPTIVISVSQGNTCYDSWYNVDASPVPAKQLVHYDLGSASSFQQGCFPPCKCPLGLPQKMSGSFDLVVLQDLGTVIEYAMVNAHFDTKQRATLASGPSHSVDGAGIYTRISGVAGWWHRLQLTGSVDGNPPSHFDNGGVNGGGDFPKIGIVVADNDFVCFNTVLGIYASPSGLSISPSAFALQQQ